MTIDTIIDQLADRVADRVVERLRGSADMIDQTASPLGNRRHCRAVQARIARGEPGAAIVGRRHLMSREAMDDELGRLGRRQVASIHHADADIDHELGLEGVA